MRLLGLLKRPRSKHPEQLSNTTRIAITKLAYFLGLTNRKLTHSLISQSFSKSLGNFERVYLFFC